MPKLRPDPAYAGVTLHLGHTATLESSMPRKPTRAQIELLERLATELEIWWHDMEPRTRNSLHRHGWIREARKVECGSRDHNHPGYCTISGAGIHVYRRYLRGPKEAK